MFEVWNVAAFADRCIAVDVAEFDSSRLSFAFQKHSRPTRGNSIDDGYDIRGCGSGVSSGGGD